LSGPTSKAREGTDRVGGGKENGKGREREEKREIGREEERNGREG